MFLPPSPDSCTSPTLLPPPPYLLFSQPSYPISSVFSSSSPSAPSRIFCSNHFVLPPFLLTISFFYYYRPFFLPSPLLYAFFSSYLVTIPLPFPRFSPPFCGFSLHTLNPNCLLPPLFSLSPFSPPFFFFSSSFSHQYKWNPDRPRYNVAPMLPMNILHLSSLPPPFFLPSLLEHG